MHKTIKLSALDCKIQWEVIEGISYVHLTFWDDGREVWCGSIEAFEAGSDDLDVSIDDTCDIHYAVDHFVEFYPDPLES